jgi:hypothetical protein
MQANSLIWVRYPQGPLFPEAYPNPICLNPNFTAGRNHEYNMGIADPRNSGPLPIVALIFRCLMDGEENGFKLRV